LSVSVEALSRCEYHPLLSVSVFARAICWYWRYFKK